MFRVTEEQAPNGEWQVGVIVCGTSIIVDRLEDVRDGKTYLSGPREEA